LIDLGSSHNYVAPKVVNSCILQKCKNKKSWLVQLAPRLKRKLNQLVEACPLEINGIFTCENLNILPLSSYDVFISMDWLATSKVKLDCHNEPLITQMMMGIQEHWKVLQNPFP